MRSFQPYSVLSTNSKEEPLSSLLGKVSMQCCLTGRRFLRTRPPREALTLTLTPRLLPPDMRT